MSSPPRPRPKKRPGRDPYDEPITMWVGNLRYSANERTLLATFRQYRCHGIGRIVIFVGGENSKGKARVEIKYRYALRAVESRMEMDGRVLQVGFEEPEGPGEMAADARTIPSRPVRLGMSLARRWLEEATRHDIDFVKSLLPELPRWVDARLLSWAEVELGPLRDRRGLRDAIRRGFVQEVATFRGGDPAYDLGRGE